MRATHRRRAVVSGRSETINKWFKILLILSRVVLATLPLGVECATTNCRRDADARVLESARRRLGLPSTTTNAARDDDDVKTVKRAFRTQALRYHPDKSRSTTRDGWSVEDAEREFQSLVDAYETVLTWTTTPGLTTCKESGETRGVGRRAWDATMDVVAGGWMRVVTRVKGVGEKVWAKTKSSAREKRRLDDGTSQTNEDERDDEDEEEEDASDTSSKTTSNIRFRGRDGSMRDAFSAVSDDIDGADDAYRLATRAFWARAKALLDDDDPDDAYVPDDDENDDVVPIDDEYPARFRSRV